MRKRIVKVAVGANLQDDRVWLVPVDHRVNHFVKRELVMLISTAGLHRNVDVVASPSSEADFMNKAADPGEQRLRRLVQRNRQHIAFVIEYALNAIPMMGIDIYLSDTLTCLVEPPCCKREVIRQDKIQPHRSNRGGSF
jgi:hypothetical protein